MPVPLSPTCLDARGYMVALGTREGPVILFDVSLRPPPISRASGALSGSANGGGGDGSGSGGASVTRVYGSLAGGEGPVSAVLLDRAKVIAAGRGSRRSGGGFVVRYDFVHKGVGEVVQNKGMVFPSASITVITVKIFVNDKQTAAECGPTLIQAPGEYNLTYSYKHRGFHTFYASTR